MSAERRREDPPVKKSKEAVLATVGRAAIFGVHHDAKLPGGFRLQKLKDNFKMADHLIMEGDPDTLRTRQTKNPQNYEDLAVSVFNYRKKQTDVHCLEPDIDLRTLVEGYGLEPDVFMGALVFDETLDLMNGVSRGKLPTPKSRYEYALQRSEYVKHVRFPTSSITQSEILESIRINMTGLDRELFNGAEVIDLFKNYKKGYSEIINYLGSVRDFELMGPEIARLAIELPGELAVVVGKFHMPAMKAALRGLPIRQPVPWDEYKEALDPEVQEAVSVFERVSQGRAAA